MQNPLPSLSRNELLAEVGWIRALAGSLVLEAGDAEDVAQEAILTALRKPPPAGRPLRPWLVRVMRNLVRERHRSAEARSQREGASAASEALPSSAELVERTELHRALVDAVLALGEPQRSTVLLHYFESMPATEIARRRGLPPATVRSHLARARRTLRNQLEERYGGQAERTSFLLASLAAPLPGTSGEGGWLLGLVKGWLLMNTIKVTAAIAATGAALVLGARLFFASAPPTTPPPSPGPALPAVAEGAQATRQLDEAPAERRKTAEPPAAAEPEISQNTPEPAIAPLPEPAQLMRETDALAFETLEGTVLLADAYELALELLAHADPNTGSWGEDGSRVFALFEDAQRGSATLHVEPGQADQFGGFRIEVRTPTEVTYGDVPPSARGTKVELRFGIEAGAISSFGSWTAIQFESDPREDYRGPKTPVGAFLRVEADAVSWRPQSLDTKTSDDGVTSAHYLFGTPEPIVVGELTDGRASELAQRLALFQVQ